MITETKPTVGSIAAQIHAVCQAAYALEAEIIGCAAFPPLRESLSDLQQCSDRFLVYERSGEVIGALSFCEGAEVVTITRLAVSPAHIRHGVATSLLGEMERGVPAMTILAVTTAVSNGPAVLLYQRRGYTRTRLFTSPEGILLIELSKRSG